MSARGASSRLLAEGAVLIRALDADGVDAIVRDGFDVRAVRYTPGSGWACSCAAVGPGCAHVLAVRQLVILDTPHDDQEPDHADQS